VFVDSVQDVIHLPDCSIADSFNIQSNQCVFNVSDRILHRVMRGKKAVVDDNCAFLQAVFMCLRPVNTWTRRWTSMHTGCVHGYTGALNQCFSLTPMLCSHYLCSQAVFTGRQYGPWTRALFWTPVLKAVFMGSVNCRSWTRRVDTGVQKTPVSTADGPLTRP